MLAMDPRYLNSSVYLYPSERDAQDGTRVGGTGFIVGVESRHVGRVPYLHIVTNKHVVDGGNHFVRFNAKQNGVEVMRTQPDEWVMPPDDDLAVLGTDLPKNIEWFAIGTDIFLGEDCLIDGWPVFPGDEVFFYGRFIQHDGRQRNKPVMRFGNVAMLPDERTPIDMRSHQQVGFLVECRSLSGFSGSPAFVKLATTRGLHPQGAKVEEKIQRQKISGRSMRFLGVDCGHFPFWSRVSEAPDPSAPTYPDMFVQTNSGIAIVIPAWRLLRVINQEPLVSEREAIEKKLDRQESAAVPDVAQHQGNEKERFTKDDFIDALKRVSRKQSDEEKSGT